MGKKQKICIFTGTRAEFGLLRPLAIQLQLKQNLEIQFLVSGSHLSPEFGQTQKEVVEAGFPILDRIEILLSSDSPVGVSKAMGLGMISFSESLARSQPDLLVILGDRYEALSIAATSAVMGIPIAHIHGGEVTEGSLDDSFRHAITKLSHLHFVSHSSYRQRVIQMGEQPNMVHSVGALGVDNIFAAKLYSKNEMEERLGIKIASKLFVVTIHPETTKPGSSAELTSATLNALQEFKTHTIIFTKANADSEGRVINSMISDFAEKSPDRVFVFSSVGNLNYLSLVSLCDAVVGNSSSGMIEAPTLRKPTINIGSRQNGRLRTTSILDCQPDAIDIQSALKLAMTEEFKIRVSTQTSLYGDGNAAEGIANTLDLELNQKINSKVFFDIPNLNTELL